MYQQAVLQCTSSPCTLSRMIKGTENAGHENARDKNAGHEIVLCWFFMSWIQLIEYWTLWIARAALTSSSFVSERFLLTITVIFMITWQMQNINPEQNQHNMLHQITALRTIASGNFRASKLLFHVSIFVSSNFVFCVFISCIFTPCDFDGPSFSRPASLVRLWGKRRLKQSW